MAMQVFVDFLWTTCIYFIPQIWLLVARYVHAETSLDSFVLERNTKGALSTCISYS